jgi:hypothetical protein
MSVEAVDRVDTAADNWKRVVVPSWFLLLCVFCTRDRVYDSIIQRNGAYRELYCLSDSILR